MANLTSFNSIGGFGIDTDTLVIDANANITGSVISSTGNITADGNIRGDYILGDGSLLTGIAPTVQVYEFANTITTGGYYEATWLASYVPGPVANVTITANTTPQIMASFITETGYPAITVIPTGTILVRVETMKSGGPQGYYIYAEIYKRSAGGTETLLLTTDVSSTITQNALVQQNIIGYVTAPIALDATDRLVAKVYAVMTSGSQDITLTFDDNTGSGLQLPALPSSVNQFVPYTGARSNVDLDGHALSSNVSLTAPVVVANTSVTFGNNSSVSDLVVTTSSTNQVTLLSRPSYQSSEVFLQAVDGNTVHVISMIVVSGSNDFVVCNQTPTALPGTFDVSIANGVQDLTVTPSSSNSITWTMMAKSIGNV